MGERARGREGERAREREGERARGRESESGWFIYIIPGFVFFSANPIILLKRLERVSGLFELMSHSI